MRSYIVAYCLPRVCVHSVHSVSPPYVHERLLRFVLSVVADSESRINSPQGTLNETLQL